jgi:hypothetical protein
MFQSRRKFSIIVPILILSIPLVVVLLSLYANSGKVAFAAAIPFPLLQIEEKIPVTISANLTTGPVTVQTITGAGGGALCEQCQFIVYKPIISSPPTKVPVIAYISATPFDLSGAKRIVFFAKGELGGETIKVLAIGKPSNLVPSLPLKGFKFGVVSADIVLTNDWKRYEFNLDGLDLKDVTGPFGLVISNHRGSNPIFPGPGSNKPPVNNGNVKEISFYLKGISIDNTLASNPINIVRSQLTSPNNGVFMLPFRP